MLDGVRDDNPALGEVRPPRPALHQLSDGAALRRRRRCRALSRLAGGARSRGRRCRSTCTSRSATRCAGSAAAIPRSSSATSRSAPISMRCIRRSTWSPRALPGRFRVRHLHWGGGSPTMLAPDDWLALIEAICAAASTSPPTPNSRSSSIPRDATEAYIAALAAAGVNRASIGVQDFDPDVQAAINRYQPFEVVERVVRLAAPARHRRRQPRSDVRPAAADRGEGAWRWSIWRCGSTPARVALFGYAHVPWMKSHQKLIDEAELPDAGGTPAPVLRGLAPAGRAGLRAVGLDHFARADDGAGGGAGAEPAASQLPGLHHRRCAGPARPRRVGDRRPCRRATSRTSQPLADYRRAIDAGRLPTARGIALSRRRSAAARHHRTADVQR